MTGTERIKKLPKEVLMIYNEMRRAKTTGSKRLIFVAPRRGLRNKARDALSDRATLTLHKLELTGSRILTYTALSNAVTIFKQHPVIDYIN